MIRRPKTALALGGGGARGLAHVGVLKVFEREGIPIDLIVGTSMGALVGAAYALEPEAAKIEARVCGFLSDESAHKGGLKRLESIRPFDQRKNDFMHRLVRIAEKHLFLSLAILRKALISEQEMQGLLNMFLQAVDIRETALPYAAVATDLISGRGVILREGPLIEAVLASSAVPGFMPPVRKGNMILADGAIIERVPVTPARLMGPDVVIAVDVGVCLCSIPPIEDGIDVINRATEIMSFHLNRLIRQTADILIEPCVTQFQWTDFLRHEHIIREGERAAEAKISEIRSRLKWRPWKRRLRGLTKKVPVLPGWGKRTKASYEECTPEWILLENR